MSLVKCPECGKEGVSSSAVACPSCGYGIKSHFDKIKNDEIEKEKEDEMREKSEALRKSSEDDLKKRSSTIKVPTKRPFINGYLIASGLLAAEGVLMFFVKETGTALVCVFVVLLFLYSGMEKLKKRQKIFDDYISDKQKYKEEIVKLQDREKAEKELVKSCWEKGDSRVKCPHCGSNNVSKIGIFSRTASVVTVGIASNKMGKQWHCNSCKSNF